jgi:uncharacterized delta-60 repeat protein
MRLNADGSLDTGFNPGNGFGQDVYAVALQPDGKVLVGGIFTTFQNKTQNRIARLNADGSLDTSFDVGAGFHNSVFVVALRPDGRVLVGGGFTAYQGTTRNRVARLNADDSFDSTFNMGTGFNNAVRALALQPDGKALVGGDFTSYQDTTRNRIARLNADGSFDSTFNMGTGFNGSVSVVTMQSDGKVLVGGSFTAYQGTTRNRLARLNVDGSFDTSFDIGTGFNSTVNAVVLQSDGKVLVGGQFTSYQGTTRNRIARLNADGSFDTTFNMGTGFGSTVYSVALKSDGKVLVGGSFTAYQGTTRNRIARLNADGSLDTSFNVGTGFNSSVSALALQSNGEVLVGGAFTKYQSTTRNYIARLNADGSLDTSFNMGTGFGVLMGGEVKAMVAQPSGRIAAGGVFFSIRQPGGTRVCAS